MWKWLLSPLSIQVTCSLVYAILVYSQIVTYWWVQVTNTPLRVSFAYCHAQSLEIPELKGEGDIIPQPKYTFLEHTSQIKR